VKALERAETVLQW